MSDVQRYETEEESHNFDMLLSNLVNKHMGTDFTVAIRESLAACRALLAKGKAKGYLSHYFTCHSLRGSRRCSCGYSTYLKAIAAQLKGTKGG